MPIRAVFSLGQTDITVNGLHQWDYGQQLEIYAEDIPGLIEVHFACAGMTEAAVRTCSIVNGVGTVSIPDDCLEQTSPILAWIYEINGTAGKTTKTITLKVIPRAKPLPGESIPTQVSDKYTEAVTAMNEQVESLKSGEVVVGMAENATNAEYATTAENATNAEYATTAENAKTANSATNATLAKFAEVLDSFGKPFSEWEDYDGGDKIAGGTFILLVPIGSGDYGTQSAIAWLCTGGTKTSVTSSVFGGYTDNGNYALLRIRAYPIGDNSSNTYIFVVEEYYDGAWHYDYGMSSSCKYLRLSTDAVG